MICLLLVEDHVSLRDALAFLLDAQPDMRVVGAVGTLREARPLLGAADIVLLDLDLPDGSGLDLIPETRRANPNAYALLLTGSDRRVEHAEGILAGASGCLHKSISSVEVLTTIRRLAAGEPLLAREEIQALARLAARAREEHEHARIIADQLTRREREVLRALLEGQNDRETAERLHISEHTLRNHIVNITSKFGAHSRLQVILMALRCGIVSFE